MNKLIASLLFATLPLQAAFAQDHSAHQTSAAPSAFAILTTGVKVTPVYQQAIPNMPGKSIKGVLVEYEPGGVNAAHTHAKSAIIYATVLEGSVLNQLNGGPLRTYTKGQNFTEMPGDRHDVSANASKTEPAKLLAVFVVDTDDVVLTTPLKQ
ncbi:cupin domain-containing protein [Cupriavidus agavae]|uniref:Quercetin dioxygenase-like cupin family protein n=1 Tax=Cupriavidus agavae TaxID=1001822 RepID=A0A4Q7R8B9_9BURK|nr:cupin domain-containing protein [Cupriavidus agavae]RZT29095.1 quercetin dioxygenase-like cupin family protein [Cupriavidus agavae]